MVVQVGNTGYNAEAFKDYSKEQFLEQFGNLPDTLEAWKKIEEHNRGSQKAAPIITSEDTEEESGIFKRRRRRKRK